MVDVLGVLACMRPACQLEYLPWRYVSVPDFLAAAGRLSSIAGATGAWDAKAVITYWWVNEWGLIVGYTVVFAELWANLAAKGWSLGCRAALTVAYSGQWPQTLLPKQCHDYPESTVAWSSLRVGNFLVYQSGYC